MSEWKKYKLSELIEIKYGKDHKHLADGDIPVYGSGGIMRYAETYLYNKESILIPRKGTLSNLFYLDKPFWSVDTMFYTKIKDGVHGKYLYYLLKSMDLASMNVGSAVPSLTTEVLNKVEVNLPNIETQKEIAQILTSLDDKIELNLQMNQTLEAMAQAIFKEWFVNFNFPGFDGELVDGLPKGWRVGVLGELVEKLSKGTTPTQKDLGSLEVQIPFLKVKDISDNGTIIKNNLELIPIEVHQNQLKRSVLQTDDILFSIAGTIGRVAILDNTLNNSNCNQAIAFIRLTEKSKYLEYVHQWLKSETVQNNIKSSIVQGVQANVSLTVLSNIDIVIPDDTTIEHWNSLIKPTYSRLLTNTHQIENLTQTRDTLLPKLMSGQLEVAV